MAASANPSRNNQEDSSAAKNGNAVNSVDNGGHTATAADNSQAISTMVQNTDWTHEEQSLLEDLLVKYASLPNVLRYAKISKDMNDKNKLVRDIAMRCRWMTKKENGKRRKEEHLSRKNKDKKDKTVDSSAKSSSHLNVHQNGPSFAPPHMMPIEVDDGISYKDIGGVSGDLLEKNAQMFNQVTSNFSALQIHENVNILCKARDNIFAILNDLNDMPEVMKQMPPLPVKVNEELANTILPRPPHPMKE